MTATGDSARILAQGPGRTKWHKKESRGGAKPGPGEGNGQAEAAVALRPGCGISIGTRSR